MVTFADDHLAFPHPVGLIERLEQVLVERYIDVPCFMGVLPGDAIAWDYIDGECGAMGYARIGAVFPATLFPEQDTVPRKIISIASVIELGIIRGAPIPDNGEAPSVEEQYDATRLQMADMRAMLDTICSYCDAHDLPVLIGSYAPAGPAGGGVGGSWTATIGAS